MATLKAVPVTYIHRGENNRRLKANGFGHSYSDLRWSWTKRNLPAESSNCRIAQSFSGRPIRWMPSHNLACPVLAHQGKIYQALTEGALLPIADVTGTLHPFNGGKFKFFVLPASRPDEHLAAASLRAQLFYPYPEYIPLDSDDRMKVTRHKVEHEAAVQYHLNTRTRSEFYRDSKMEFLGMKVTCFLAVCERSEHEGLLASLSTEERRSLPNGIAKPPEIPDPTPGSMSNLVAIGTLDVQVGKTLPGENLKGIFPLGERASLERGYIFNLCVLHSARRRGVASALMETAALVARGMGLTVLYCHVEANNAKASALYKSLGYVVEQEEDIAVEKKLNRCRRLLLRHELTEGL